MLSDSAILKKIEKQPKQTAGFKQLAHELGAHGDSRRELHERLQNLVSGGQLRKLDSDRYAIPQKVRGKDVLVGRLTMHRDGFGFVIPESASLDPKLKGRLSGDIFIPPPAVGSSIHGDQVLVEVGTIRPDGRAEGRILRTVNRAHSTIVGTFHYGGRRNFVTPIDQKIGQEIVIPTGMEYPPAQSEKETASHDSNKSRHRVVGKEAASHADWADLENVVVDVEITDWPTATQAPRGRVVEILGYQDDFGVDVEIIIRKFHLPHRFPAEVLTEAEETEPIISFQEVKRRRDFRNLPIVTIDGETARDFDDAVTVTQWENVNSDLQIPLVHVFPLVLLHFLLAQEA